MSGSLDEQLGRADGLLDARGPHPGAHLDVDEVVIEESVVVLESRVADQPGRQRVPLLRAQHIAQRPGDRQPPGTVVLGLGGGLVFRTSGRPRSIAQDFACAAEAPRRASKFSQADSTRSAAPLA